ncbi:MAG: patatin-like phospholipase family protein [Verrucomicrobiales bacterium]|nr:patatin-like phospholipase family protein [Verrucomicrobiales bacterium]
MAAFLHLFDALRPGREAGKVEERPPRPRIGLALSSGGAKGLAHIGVIQVLEENGIEVDAVAGTSMGAYVGGLWASGLNGKELEGLAADMTRRRDLLELLDPVFPPRRGFVRGANIHKRLEKTLQDRTFEGLEKSFLAVATEFDTLERAVFRSGDVASAIVASLAVPGVVVPFLRDGIEYIDGGVCDPLPVGLAKSTWDLDYVIAVNVLPPIGSLRRRSSHGRRRNYWRRGLGVLNQHLNYFARGNLLDILRAAAMGSQMRLVEKSAREADVLISPLSPKTGWHDYHRYAKYIEIGREAAMQALPEIEALFQSGETSPTYGNTNRKVTSCA